MRPSLLLAVLVSLTTSACVLDLDDDDDDDGAGNPGSRASCGGFAGQTCTDAEYCDYEDDSCGIADRGGVCRGRPRVCAEIDAPVTGSDGREYENACSAHAAGADDCGRAD